MQRILTSNRLLVKLKNMKKNLTISLIVLLILSGIRLFA